MCLPASRRRRWHWTVAAAVCLAAFGAPPVAFAAVNVSINSGLTYQTIIGWGNNFSSAGSYPDVPAVIVDQMKQDTVENLGISWIRMGSPVNLDGEWIDVPGTLVDFRDRVEAAGAPFHIQAGGQFGPFPETNPRLYFSSGYYADANVSLWKPCYDQYGIQPTYFNVVNEPDDQKRDQPSWLVMEHGRELVRRAAEQDLDMTVSWADCESVDREMRYINQQAGSGIFDDGTVGMISYHAYGSTNETSWRNQIRDFARSKGLPTSMTENNRGDVYEFVDDLVEADVSRYLVPHFYNTAVNDISASRTTMVRGPHFWSFRQITHYVRPGAVRISAGSSSGATLMPVAFDQDGGQVLVLPNESYSQQTVNVSGLAAGQYGMSRSVNNAPAEELGILNVGGSFQVNVPSRTVLTIYPHAAGTDLPPQMNTWRASPEYILPTSSSVSLTVDADDPELAGLNYSWTLASEPAGANVSIANPFSAGTSASGMTVNGDYTFEVAVSDGNAANDQVRTVVVNRSPNAAPRIVELFTIPNELEIGQSMAVLAGIQDREDQPDMDNPTSAISYLWSVVESPPGGTVHIDNPTFRGATLTNWSEPGTYRFRLRVSDPSGNVTVRDSGPVTVYPQNLYAPAISSISCVVTGQTTALLSANTSDLDGDDIVHWWRLADGLAGAEVVFETPDETTTKVSGLTAGGHYTFELAAIDRSKWTHATTDASPIFRVGPPVYVGNGLFAFTVRLAAADSAEKIVAFVGGFAGPMNQIWDGGGSVPTPTLDAGGAIDLDQDSHFLLYDADILGSGVSEDGPGTGTLLDGTFTIDPAAAAQDLPFAQVVLSPGTQVQFAGSAGDAYDSWVDLSVAIAAPVYGDANIDGKVGIADLSALADHYGAGPAATWAMGDFNGDGLVGIADLSALADNYGRQQGSTVPEPMMVCMLLAGLPMILRRRPTV